MPRLSFILLLLVLFATASCFADVIHLKSGRRLEVENAQIVGDKVTFRVMGGNMSVALSAVVKIEKSSAPVNTRAGFRPAIAESTQPASRNTPIPVNSSGGVTFSSTSTKHLAFMQRVGPENPNASNYNSIAAQKLLLMKSQQVGNGEIGRLQNILYTKTSLGSSTRDEKRKIAEIQKEMSQMEYQLSQFKTEARKAGLNEDEIAIIDSLSPDGYTIEELAEAAGAAILGPMMEQMMGQMKDLMKDASKEMAESLEGTLDDMGTQIQKQIEQK